MTLTSPGIETTERAGRMVELATQYFAYMAGISVAVAVAAVTLVYSAQTALSLVDVAAFPERHPTTQARPAALPAQPDKVSASNTFAMLPSAIPLTMKSDVLSSNF